MSRKLLLALLVVPMVLAACGEPTVKTEEIKPPPPPGGGAVTPE